MRIKDLYKAKENSNLNSTEIISAKGNSESLKDELDRRSDVLQDNIVEQYLPVTFTGSHKAENTYNGKALNCVVQGRTYKNLFAGDNINFTFDKDNNNTRSKSYMYQGTVAKDKITIMGSISQSKNVLKIQLDYADGTNSTANLFNNEKVAISTGGKAINTFMLYISEPDFTAGVRVSYKDIMFIEGEVTENLTHFEGITSTGSAENNTLRLKSTGKNLVREVLYKKQVQGILAGQIQTIVNSPTRAIVQIKVSPSASYTITSNSKNTRYYYIESDIEKRNVYGGSDWITSSKKITTSSKTSYLSIVITKSLENNAEPVLNDLDIFEYQVEAGDVSTDYEPCKESQVACKLPFEGGLKGINGVEDKWRVNEGKIEQAIGRTILDGSRSWGLYVNRETTVSFRADIDGKGVSDRLCVLSDKFPTTDIISGNDYEGVSIHSDGKIFISILKSKLTTPDLIGFKKWLQSNPVAVYYPLATPTTHEIPPQKLSTFKPMTYITQNNSIVGETSCKVRVDVASVLSDTRNNFEKQDLVNDIVSNNIIKQEEYFNDRDLALTENALNMDLRVLDIEIALSIPVSLNMGVQAMSPYEMMKTLILNGRFERADMEAKIAKYLKYGKISQEQADELISLMDAVEMVRG